MSHIWVPRVKILEPRDEIKLNAGGVAGFYTLTKRKADTLEVTQQLGPFKNLITDLGLDQVGKGRFCTYCFVGSGSAAPATTDTQLQNYLAYTGTQQVGATGTLQRGDVSQGYWVQGSITFRFAAGVAAGNISEVGVGNFEPGGETSVNHRVSSRALILDGLGSPTTITVLSDEVLDVTYAPRHYPYLGADVVQTVYLSGVPYQFTTRSLALLGSSHQCNPYAGNVYPYSQSDTTWCTGTAAGTPPTLAGVTATAMLAEGSTSNSASSMSRAAYVAGSHENAFTLTLGLANGNLAYGLRGLRQVWQGSGTISFCGQSFQSEIFPAIPKDSTKVMTIGFKKGWARY